MSDDRADRLSRRRKDRSQSRDDASSDNTFKTVNTANTEKAGKTDSSSTVGNLTENTQTQMMHLPEEQHKRLMHLYTRMKADYEYEFDDEFEKNRHYFPLILQYGLDQFEERDATGIRQFLLRLHMCWDARN